MDCMDTLEGQIGPDPTNAEKCNAMNVIRDCARGVVPRGLLAAVVAYAKNEWDC